MKYEGLKRFVKHECITSFAFFSSPVLYSELSVRMHEKWNRNDDQTKEIAYSNTVKHTNTCTRTAYTIQADGLKSLNPFALLCFALVTHKIQTTSEKVDIIENISMHTGT